MAMTAAEFGYISTLVRQESAIVLEPGKEYLVEARLMPLARRAGVAGVSDIVRQLQKEPRGALRDQVVEAMTTNETSWFRDRVPFTALTDSVLPEVMAKRTTERALNIWCAACSSGQEPYTIAMLMSDIPALAGWRTSILATDLSEEMLAKARNGRYSQLEVNRGLPAQLLIRHFERSGTEFAVKPALKSVVNFRPMNLATQWPTLPAMDVVFLRNVLIYFDVETKRNILERMRRVLRPDGYLFLGAAETTLNVHPAYERVTLNGATVYKLTRGA
jgi:chemotaxis protein methyltransferase CheR